MFGQFFMSHFTAKPAKFKSLFKLPLYLNLEIISILLTMFSGPYCKLEDLGFSAQFYDLICAWATNISRTKFCLYFIIQTSN